MTNQPETLRTGLNEQLGYSANLFDTDGSIILEEAGTGIRSTLSSESAARRVLADSSLQHVPRRLLQLGSKADGARVSSSCSGPTERAAEARPVSRRHAV